MKIVKATAGIKEGREYLDLELEGYALDTARLWAEDLGRWFNLRETTMVFMGVEWEGKVPAVEKNGASYEGYIETGSIPAIARKYLDGVLDGSINPGDEVGVA